MPLIPGFVNSLNNIIDLHKKKNDDYSGDKGPFFNFDFCTYISSLFEYAEDKVYVVFISVKIARLSVVLSAKVIKNESIEDSFDDLICYCTIWKCKVMQRLNNKPTSEQELDQRVSRINNV